MKRFTPRFRNFLTRGRSLFLFSGSIYKEDSALTAHVRRELERAGVAQLASGTIFVRLSRHRAEKPSFIAPVSLLVQGFGRFGNMLIQLGNLTMLSEVLGSQDIYFWESRHFSSPVTQIGRKASLVRATIRTMTGRPKPEFVFRTRAFPGPVFPRMLSQETAHALQLFLEKEIFGESLKTTRLKEKHLVIHLRSGDVFGVNPHPNYGQPPLAFYKRVLAHDHWDKVTVVAEDTSNPVCNELLSLLDNLGIPTLLSGETLESALSEIRNSRYLVSSAGTFCPAICWLSPTPRVIFHFGPAAPTSFPLRSATFVLFEDQSGDYSSAIMEGNWKNSAEQQKLMLTYPESAITVKRDQGRTTNHRATI